jgi:hypothetical protein
MSSATTAPTPILAPDLSHGVAIEYRAYTRKFYPNQDGAVLFLAATCNYGSSGRSIFFQSTGANTFTLMENRPSGVVSEIVTYYSASWNSSQQEFPPPSHVTITDAFGDHHVHVKAW